MIFFRCKVCLVIDRTDIYSKNKHVCGQTDYCHVCREKKAKDHECSHKIPIDKDKKKSREKQENWKVLVYDMECIVASSGTFKGKKSNILLVYNRFLQRMLPEVPNTNPI